MTTTIEIAEPASPQVPAIIARIAVGVLTVAAVGWGIVSLALITMPQSPFLLRLLAVGMDAMIGTFVVYCWNQVR